MAEMEYKGGIIAYEVYGEGQPMVFMPGGNSRRNEWTYLNAGRLWATNKVVIWDRPYGDGASTVIDTDAETVVHLWTDCLHALINELGLGSTVIAGGSGGNTTSLLMGYRYPEDAEGLFLISTPTDQPELLKRPVDWWFYDLAGAAETGGMQAVLDFSIARHREIVSGTAQGGWLSTWVGESLRWNDEYRERFLAMDPADFAGLMRRSGDFLMSDRLFASGLTDEQLAQISLPVLVAHGPDDLHPRSAAERLFKLLPNAEWVEYSDRWGDKLQEMLDEPFTISANEIKRYMPFLLDWLKRLED